MDGGTSDGGQPHFRIDRASQHVTRQPRRNDQALKKAFGGVSHNYDTTIILRDLEEPLEERRFFGGYFPLSLLFFLSASFVSSRWMFLVSCTTYKTDFLPPIILDPTYSTKGDHPKEKHILPFY